MKYGILLILVNLLLFNSCFEQNNMAEKDLEKRKNELTELEKYVILYKGTERPFTGKYYNHFSPGIYKCKLCGTPLFKSEFKFDSGCGWPSFDDELPGAVTKTLDADGSRTEITCTNCGAHLGHVFFGEGFTEKNVRHCVNSISLEFEAYESLQNQENNNIETAIFAGGCFWGVEYYFQNIKGVISTEVGYTGGFVENPTYKQVCYENTGHAEAVKIVFDKTKVSYEDLCKTFFEIHDPGQLNRQGPDVGEQYRSEIFYTTDEQKIIAEKLIAVLTSKGHKVYTKLTPAGVFYPAEDYHQKYYKKNGNLPYCHFYKKKF